VKALLLALVLALMTAGTALAAEPVPVDLNTASEGQLEQLPGIGPKKAAAIVELRKKRLFSRLTQLMEVRGIGKKTLERLRPYVKIGEPPPAPPVAPQAR
jgi:competence protein ComEA